MQAPVSINLIQLVKFDDYLAADGRALVFYLSPAWPIPSNASPVNVLTPRLFIAAVGCGCDDSPAILDIAGTFVAGSMGDLPYCTFDITGAQTGLLAAGLRAYAYAAIATTASGARVTLQTGPMTVLSGAV